MNSNADLSPYKPLARVLLSRFSQLLSAQGLEAILSFLFLIYLAWANPLAYGLLIYATAAGSLVMKGMQFGLFYPLVKELAIAPAEDAPAILQRANMIKLALMGPALGIAMGMVMFTDFSPPMVWSVVLIVMGFALESLSETFFADFRVRGRQGAEARIKMASHILGYGYGCCVAFAGLPLVFISLFKVLSGTLRLTLATRTYLQKSAGLLSARPQWKTLRSMFRTASTFALIEVVGIAYNTSNIFFLESIHGVKAVASYGATWNIVDAISTLVSDQFLGWVVFPALVGLWWKSRDHALLVAGRTALWLMALAFPFMFFLYIRSDLIIGIVYPPEYRDAIWMQRYLVWTILISFENNLFSYLLMVGGAIRTLLLLELMTLLINMALNLLLIEPLGLLGACLVIVLTKLSMGIFTFCICQIRFKLIRVRDLIFPMTLAAACLLIYFILDRITEFFFCPAIVLIIYIGVLWKAGPRIIGTLQERET